MPHEEDAVSQFSAAAGGIVGSFSQLTCCKSVATLRRVKEHAENENVIARDCKVLRLKRRCASFSPPQFMRKTVPCTRLACPASSRLKVLGAATVISILSGPIQAQTVPVPATLRAWDNSGGDFLWGNDLNWFGDVQPGIDEIANINLNTPPLTVAATIDLGGVSREVGGLLFSVNTPFSYMLSNGTLIANSISQTQDDPNQINANVFITTKNTGADVLRVSVSSNTLQLQGKITSGGLIKAGGSVLRLGTSGTDFVNAINGDIVTYGGTLTASGTNTATGNPLGGTGNLVIASTAQVTLDTLDALDFGRDIFAGNNNLTILNQRFGTTGTVTNAEQRVGTINIGTATLRVFHNATSVGFFTGSDGLNLASGATTTIQVDTNGRLETDSLIGAANTQIIKTGNAELRIRGNNASTFSGDFELRDGTLRFDAGTGTNPLGNAATDIGFGGLGTLQLRSDVASDYAANIRFNPGIIAGTISIDRIATPATAQTLSLGAATLPNGVTLNVNGANSYVLSLTAVNLGAGATSILSTNSANTTVAALTGDAASTLIKRGGSTLILSGDNGAGFLGTLTIQGGAVTASAANAIGSKPVVVGDSITINPTGNLSFIGRLNVNATGFSGNTGPEPDVTVHASSMVDLNVVPTTADTFRIKEAGVLLGSATQMPALDAGPGGNLVLEPGAVLAFEANGSPLPANLPATGAGYFYGVGTSLTNDVTIGAGTPWRGISNDQSARTLNGSAVGTPAIITINGGDNNPATIEATLQGLNGTTLSFGTDAAGDPIYNWASASGQKATLAIRGVGGTGLAPLTPGGNVAFEDDAATSLLAAIVDKILVQSGTLLLGDANSLGGVPVEVQGGLDVRVAAAIDAALTVKSGGVLWLNDNFDLTGSGSITIEGGGKLDMMGAPATLLSSSQAINFTGTGHTVRFNANDIVSLNTIPANGVTFVVGGLGTAANIPNTNITATLNTQTGGIRIENGILTNDGTTRAFAGPITLNNTNLTVAATRNTQLAVTSDISTTGAITIGSETPIDFRFKNDANATRADNLPDPFNSSPQVHFTGAFQAGSLTATGTHLGFANATTNVTGDLNVGNVLYLDGGGSLSGGTAVRGDLTPRLTDTSGLPANRVASRIILGNYGRIELSVTSGAAGTTTNHTITQPFVIEGAVNPTDKRTFWVDRGTGAGTTNVFFNDVLVRANAQLGYDENNTIVRSNVRLEGNANFTRIDDWDLGSVTREPAAPANITVSIGQPSTAPGGSNGTLIQSVNGVVSPGITMDLIRGQLFVEQSATMNGVIRAQTAPAGGDAFVVFRSNLPTPHTFASTTAEVQIGRSGAANGPEDFELRGAEVAAGEPAATLTFSIPLRVVNDSDNTNIDAIIRSNRNNDAATLAETVIQNVNVDAGATVQFNSQTQTSLTIPNLNMPGGGGIDSTNSSTVFLGAINGGANPLSFTGPAQARVTGNITASAINVTGAGIDFDPGAGNTSTANAPLTLSGRISVRTGTADLGANVITGAPTQTVAGLRENKTQGSFDQTTPNFSNKIALGTDFAQLATLAWGENQTVTYTGRINVPDNGTPADGQGSIAFAKAFDDSALIAIDGVVYMRHTGFNDAVGTGAINLTAGWHDIEIRMGQGIGGAGPVAQDGGGFSLGLGIDLTDPIDNNQNAGLGNVLDFRPYVAPVDNGSQNLFQTTTVKGSIAVDADATLKARGFTNLGTIDLTGFNAAIELTGTAASDADAIVISGGANGTLRAPGSVMAGRIDLDGNLNKDGAGSLFLSAAGTGSGFGVLEIDGGSLLLQPNASVNGNVTASAGTSVRGSGTISGTLTAEGASTIAPGESPGRLTVGGFDLRSTARLQIELNGTTAGTGYDQILVPSTGIGNVALGGVLDTTLGFVPNRGDVFLIILNSGLGTLTGTFSNAPADRGTLTIGGMPFTIDYFYPGDADLRENDVALIAQIPEPGSFAILCSGVSALLGLQRFRRRLR